MSDPSGIVWDDQQQMGPPAALAGPAPAVQGIKWDDEQPQQQPGMVDQLGRALGQTARYGMEGAGNAVGVLSDPIQAMLGAATGQNDQYKPLGERAANLADELGLPKAQGKLEKGVEGASKAFIGSALTMGAGSAAGASEPRSAATDADVFFLAGRLHGAGDASPGAR